MVVAVAGGWLLSLSLHLDAVELVIGPDLGRHGPLLPLFVLAGAQPERVLVRRCPEVHLSQRQPVTVSSKLVQNIPLPSSRLSYGWYPHFDC